MQVLASNRPPIGKTLNKSHPLSSGLVACWVINDNLGGTPIELIKNVPSVAGTYHTSPKGSTFVSTTLLTNDTNLDFGNNPFSIVAGFTVDGGYGAKFPNIFGKYSYTDETTNSGYSVSGRPIGEGYFICFSVFNNVAQATYQLNSTFAVSTAANYGYIQVIGTSTGSTGAGRSIYINGRLTATKAAAVPGTPTVGVNLGDNLAYGVNCELYYGYIYNRTLTPNDVAQLYTNPYQMFKK